MQILLVGCILFAVSFVTHLILWKLRRPRHSLKALAIIFAAIFFLGVIHSFLRAAPLFEFLHAALFYLSITLCYLITYTAIEGDSPTLCLMGFISEHQDVGVSAEEAVRFLSKRPFAGTRLRALVRTGLVREQNGRFVIVGKGSLAFRLILTYRKLYGPISKGG